MRVKLLPLLLCLGLVSMPGHGEDLMDAFHQALANDPVLSTADAARLVVAEGVPQARAALLPQLSAELGLQRTHGDNGEVTNNVGTVIDTGGGRASERDLSGTLSQRIFDLSAIANLKAAQSSRDAGDQTYQAALQNLYVRVCNAYFNVLVSEDNLGVYKSYEDAYKQEFNQSSTRFKNGLATASDVSQSQAYYYYIKSQRISAQDSLKDANRALQQITGQPTGSLKKLRDDLPLKAPQPASPDAWVAAAMASNPVILAGHDAVRADEHRVSAARAGHLPTIDASLQYGKLGSWSSTAVPGYGNSAAYGPGVTTIGVTLRVPIFSGGLTQSQVRQAIAQRDEDAGTLETNRRQAARDAENYYNLVVDGIDQVEAARTSVEAARKSLTSMRAGYEIGTQSLTNVVFAIEQLANVQSEYIVVRHEFILNKLLLKQAAGSVDIHDLEDINSLLE